jgi:hypothetical protein
VPVAREGDVVAQGLQERNNTRCRLENEATDLVAGMRCMVMVMVKVMVVVVMTAIKGSPVPEPRENAAKAS